MEKLKIAGAWAGVLEVKLEEWTVAMLREEIAKRSGCEGPPESIKLICGGKVLKDGDRNQNLGQLGIKNNSKVLACRTSADQGKELIAEEERNRRLSRIKAAVTSMAKRHADGVLPFENFNIELENQSGEKVQLGSETDQRAIMTGLMLHQNSKPLIRREKYKEALEILTMGEEAFSLCNSKAIELIDNVPILQIDMVWCYFMLRDISWLSVAGMRLSKAREGLERAHGKESSRLRLLQGGYYPEIALHLRLELLEGVVAYHNGQFEKSRQALISAQTKFLKLQVSDEALSQLLGMGYKERAAKRALRMSNQDVASAVDFLVQETYKRAQKQEEDVRRRNEIMEQKRYGVTPLKKPVDLQRLKELTDVGFEKELAAEALRRHENDTQKALDDLTNPEANSRIQVDIETRKRKKQSQAADGAIKNLVSMGYPRERVVEAVREFGADGALDHLLENIDPSISSAAAAGGISTPTAANPEGVTSSGTGTKGAEGSSGSSGPSLVEDTRDVEMEEELAAELYKQDAYSDYDIEVVKEGEAINEYVGMLDLAAKGEKASSSSC